MYLVFVDSLPIVSDFIVFRVSFHPDPRDHIAQTIFQLPI